MDLPIRDTGQFQETWNWQATLVEDWQIGATNWKLLTLIATLESKTLATSKYQQH